MAAVETSKTPSLAEQYVPRKDVKSVEVYIVKSTAIAVPEEAVNESAILPTAADENDKATEESVEIPAVIEEVSEEVKVNESEETTEVIEYVGEESKGTAEDENSDQEEVAEETPEIKLETAPADFRFPNPNHQPNKALLYKISRVSSEDQ